MKNHKSNTIIYRWKGINQMGKQLSGTITAHHITHAKSELLKQGIITRRITKAKPALMPLKSHSIKADDIALFTRQLSTMIDAGLPLVQSLDIIAKGHKNPTFQQLVLTVKKAV
jgi:type IV pilus assembly protein PilC